MKKSAVRPGSIGCSGWSFITSLLDHSNQIGAYWVLAGFDRLNRLRQAAGIQ
ncbi:MAG TPA: hypothetical protein VJ981_04660 [Gammaproteobacteria bacterium]|nr:hypothetical protein [Gammaproteobacteria bacterium]